MLALGKAIGPNENNVSRLRSALLPEMTLADKASVFGETRRHGLELGLEWAPGHLYELSFHFWWD